MREYRDVYDVKEHAESDTKEGRGVSKNEQKTELILQSKQPHQWFVASFGDFSGGNH